MTDWRLADLPHVRATIAQTLLGNSAPDHQLGNITLRDHQQDAAARLRRAIQLCGGALLADDVGLGKTYTALAAARDVRPLLVVAPAALTSMWATAVANTRLEAEIISLESLSRREAPRRSYGLIVVDEAHHARNQFTRRYDRLAALTRSTPVLLLSATPLHNTTSDLHSLLALFLGARAERLTPAQLSACVVRRTRSDVQAVLPHRAPPVWLDVGGHQDVLTALLDIPAPCPPRDGGDAGVLVTFSLVRAWASTDGALRSALRRRIARAQSLADSLDAGRYPTRSELLSWVVGEDATQLAFPELMSDAMAGNLQLLRDAVRQHVAGAKAALEVAARQGETADDKRAALLRDLRARHPNERIVVFSQFADSVHAMFARLRADGRVAAVTAQGAMVAGGPLTRTQVLARFAPGSSGRPPSRAEAIDLLLTTDLLSEGLNLQDASIVVHLDLPWTAARLTQRLGRIWRMASPHDHVSEYALRPPGPADQLLRLTEILRRKAGSAWRALGELAPPLLGDAGSSTSHSPDATAAHEELRRLLREWRADAPTEPHASRTSSLTAVSAARGPFDGWIAAIGRGASARVVAKKGYETATSDPRNVLDVSRAAAGSACTASPARIRRSLSEVEAFVGEQQAAQDAGVVDIASRVHVNAESRIAAFAASAPAHQRVAASRLAANARRAVATSRTAGAERLLAALVDSADAENASPESWLNRLIETTSISSPNATFEDAEAARAIRAVVLVVPGTT
jgi:superfamily II DNA or RNA helicase